MGGAWRFGIGAAAALLAAGPVAAQFSSGYNFLKAVRDADGTKALEFLNRPGRPEIDSRDGSTGETALHIVVRRHDTTWMNAILARGARTELRDNGGDTPLLAAAKLSDVDAVHLLLDYKASVNATDNQGQTPLIVATQHRDLPTVRLLLAAGANPAQPDRVSGKTARDYAGEDPRGGPVLKLLQEAKAPAAARPVAGPMPH